MSDDLRGVVVCHGGLAAAMVDAVEEICGIHDVLVPVTNTGCDRASLRQRLAEAIDGRRVVVFVDLPTGSCLMAALQEVREISGVRVVTGVNLPMLLDFVFRLNESPDDAADRAVEMGAQSIGMP
jgi:mannose/fructose-specific phosphotransferase system component IIA